MKTSLFKNLCFSFYVFLIWSIVLGGAVLFSFFVLLYVLMGKVCNKVTNESVLLNLV